MADPDPAFTAEELAALKALIRKVGPEGVDTLAAMVQGHRAVTWLSTRIKGLAVWVAVVIGAAIAVLQILDKLPKAGGE